VAGSDPRGVGRDELASILLSFVGEAPWRAAVSYGSYIHVDFGVQRPSWTGRFTRGDWTLWTDQAAWRIDGQDGMVGGSEDDRDTMSRAVQTLVGRRLEAVTVADRSPEASFRFQGEYELKIFPVYSSGRDHWSLAMPDNMVLKAGPGNVITLERLGQRDDRNE
jgi:hypothetical protein